MTTQHITRTADLMLELRTDGTMFIYHNVVETFTPPRARVIVLPDDKETDPVFEREWRLLHDE